MFTIDPPMYQQKCQANVFFGARGPGCGGRPDSILTFCHRHILGASAIRCTQQVQNYSRVFLRARPRRVMCRWKGVRVGTGGRHVCLHFDVWASCLDGLRHGCLGGGGTWRMRAAPVPNCCIGSLPSLRPIAGIAPRS